MPFNAEVCYLDRLVASVSELIHVIREYRSALISAAVTGKIDVRGFKPEEENTSTTRKRVSLRTNEEVTDPLAGASCLY